MSKRVVVIGIDSMDSLIVNKYIDSLPTIRELIKSNPDLKSISVFPPDSDTAWASIYTGLCPAKHGVVNFVDPLEKSIKIQNNESDSEKIMGKTFWDYASLGNKKVCILLPHIAYPPWKVNGTMVSRSRIEDRIKSIPSEFNEYSLNNLSAPKGVPKKDISSLTNLITIYKELVQNETDFFEKMISKYDWDLFFCYSSALDAIQHYFWNYCHDNCSDEKYKNGLSDVIKDFYILYDIMIKKLLKNVGKEATVLILSDHGHCGRPQKIININQILLEYGFVKSKNKNTFNKTSSGFKSKSIELVSKYELGWIASKALKLMPAIKEIYSTPSFMDMKSSLAYATDLSGIKAYSYGGIIINKNNMESYNYESLRDEIIFNLNKSIGNYIEWIAKREKLYTGRYIDAYPDIILQLKMGYGLGNRINAPIFDKTYTSNIVPGSHRGDTPIFLVHNTEQSIIKKSIELTDIAPTILDLLGLREMNLAFEGKSIFQI